MRSSKIGNLIQEILKHDPVEVQQRSRTSYNSWITPKEVCIIWQLKFALQILDRSPVELEVQSFLQILKYAVLEICAQWSWIQSCIKKTKLKSWSETSSSPKTEVSPKCCTSRSSIKRGSSQKSILHPRSREVKNEIAGNLVIRGSTSVQSVRSNKVEKPVMSWHWMKWILISHMLEVEVTPLTHCQPSQVVMLQEEVAHAHLFFHTEVVTYLDVQEVLIKDTIPEVSSTILNSVIDGLTIQTNCN